MLQRVSRARVCVGGEVVGSVGRGYLLLVGFTHGDDGDVVEWMAGKVHALRLFPDEEGRMNRALDDVEGGVLVVSQFTLYADARKGRRPSFVDAADPAEAEALYRRFVAELERRLPGRVATGRFGAFMEVELVNDGPVTLVLERP